MNKVISWAIFGVLCFLPAGQAKADTLSDLYNSFATETKLSFAERSITIYGLDVNNGQTNVGTGVSILDSGPLSIDTGLLLPTESSKVGTPLIGVSVHFDRLLNIIAPALLPKTRDLAPNTMQSFLDKIFIGFAPIYNFNAQSNERALKAEIYSGLEFKF